MEYFESCSSSLKPSHVYISFRGDEDTRKFMHSFSAALKAQGFTIFGDDKRRETPDSYLPQHLRQAISESWIWIVVFSKNYASSSWCLTELHECATWGCAGLYALAEFLCENPLYDEGEEMYEANIDKVDRWRRAMKKWLGLPCSRSDKVIAVYYDVDPKSFTQHIEQSYTQARSKYHPRLSDLWISTLIEEVASFPCWDVRNDSGPQAIQRIVKQVKSRIDQRFYDFFGFVGIQSQVEEVEKLLDLSKDDEVRVVGICGMVRLGKSTIARVLYFKIIHYFDAFCFVPNVSAYLKEGGLSLQELLRRYLETENSEIRDIVGQEFLACKMLRKHKFLIVLDGVDLVQDIEELNLIEKSDCFGGGSRIILTTRDVKVLQKYEAYPKKYPVSDFKELIDRVLEYANGLPLAIEKLGSSFFGKGIAEWRSLLDREEIIPPRELIMLLRKSFDELDDLSQEMFLDIACFFVGKDINYVKEILYDCISFRVDTELLVQKSLITIANQKIQMHRMLQAMGREIIRKRCPNQPDKRSRLYLYSDIKHVMEKQRNTVITDVEAIALDLEEHKRATLRIDALSDMINLRLLILHNVKSFGTLENLSSELRYVSWHQYPFTGLPSIFQSDTLVQLIMPESNMIEVWKGKMMLPNLRKINLCGSKTLTKTPDFGGVPNLERLELEGCTGLLQLDPSIAHLSKLKFLNLRNCINLISIPNSMFSYNSLEVLNLAGCSKLAYCLKFSPVKSM
ncbi:hypothetical protein K1719_043808 [Acacia pycnantha]|nr:hypothetical protein K1719_043808 [Acacia pycnantha]